MYIAEAELLVIPRAESFLGHYGVVITQPETYHMDGTSDGLTTEPIVAPTGWALNLKLAGRQIAGKKLPERNVEHITSLEQAEKYIAPAKHDFQIKGRDVAKVIDTLNNYQGPEDAEALSGNAFLWKERRLPSRHLYAAAFGKLLFQYSYDPEENDWLMNLDTPIVDRRRLGLMTSRTLFCFTNLKVAYQTEPDEPADSGTGNIPFCS